MQPQSQLLNSAIAAKTIVANTSRHGSSCVWINLIYKSRQWAALGLGGLYIVSWARAEIFSRRTSPTYFLIHQSSLRGHRSEPQLSAKLHTSSPSQPWPSSGGPHPWSGWAIQWHGLPVLTWLRCKSLPSRPGHFHTHLHVLSAARLPPLTCKQPQSLMTNLGLTNGLASTFIFPISHHP